MISFHSSSTSTIFFRGSFVSSAAMNAHQCMRAGQCGTLIASELPVPEQCTFLGNVAHSLDDQQNQCKYTAVAECRLWMIMWECLEKTLIMHGYTEGQRLKPCPHCHHRIRRQSTVAVFGDKLSPKSATIVASVDRL